MKTTYSYKDIVLQPAYSEIESRSKLDASIEFLGKVFESAAIPANMKPIWPIELYAISRFMLACPIAATEPKIIDAIDIKITIVCHSTRIFLKGISMNLIKIAKPAILGTTAKKFVIDVGAPS